MTDAYVVDVLTLELLAQIDVVSVRKTYQPQASAPSGYKQAHSRVPRSA
jgi:hypothetical protein